MSEEDEKGNLAFDTRKNVFNFFLPENVSARKGDKIWITFRGKGSKPLSYGAWEYEGVSWKNTNVLRKIAYMKNEEELFTAVFTVAKENIGCVRLFLAPEKGEEIFISSHQVEKIKTASGREEKEMDRQIIQGGKMNYPKYAMFFDMHTMQACPDVGHEFCADEFAENLKNAHVEPVGFHAKCNQGFCYFVTKTGIRHPALPQGKDLFGEVVESCSLRGIRVSAYFNCELSNEDGLRHPEWSVSD